MSKNTITEIKAFLDDDDNWGSGPFAIAINHMLVHVKLHDYHNDIFRWRFETTFGIDLDSCIKIGLCGLITIAVICTQLWSVVSWFVQLKRLFVVCFLVSIIWNWCYLYKIAFAEHQLGITKMDNLYETCAGIKPLDWSDSLKEWFRSTWTLQDDPCKRYYELMVVNPILLVPPTKAIAVTITTLITEPLKHVGQGISEFLRALLKDLPITLQIPGLCIVGVMAVVFVHTSVYNFFTYGVPTLHHHQLEEPPKVYRKASAAAIEHNCCDIDNDDVDSMIE